MPNATHSDREAFVLALGQACPQATSAQVQRLLRLASGHARIVQDNADHKMDKLIRIQNKIKVLTREWKLGVSFVLEQDYTVRLIVNKLYLPVPTSKVEP